MQLQHVNVKVFAEDPGKLDLEKFIPIFHAWIQDQALEEMLIDVADYRHVWSGPGVVLIGFQGDYGIDLEGNRPGLRYNRKAALDGDNRGRFRQAARAALNACRMLERDPRAAGLKFSRREIELLVNDRALAPNSPETLAACRPEIEAFFRELLGHTDFTLEHDGDPRRRFAVLVKCARPFDLDRLLAALA